MAQTQGTSQDKYQLGCHLVRPLSVKTFQNFVNVHTYLLGFQKVFITFANVFLLYAIKTELKNEFEES